MLPDYAMIEPTTVCNIDCVSCFRKELLSGGNITVGSLSVDGLKYTHSVLPGLKHIRFHGMGEFFLLKNHVEMIECLRSLYPIAWIELVTNGQYVNTEPKKIASLVDRVTFSMSGGDKASYESFHTGGVWKTFVGNLHRFEKHASKLNLEVNYVCTLSNVGGIDKAVAFCAAAGVPKMRVNVYQDWLGKGNKNMAVNVQHVEAIKGAIKTGSLLGVSVVIVGNVDFDTASCLWMKERILIAHNGDVLPCCMRPDHSLSLGNINKDCIDDIWNKGKITEFRELRSKHALDFCRNCPYHDNIELLKGLL